MRIKWHIKGFPGCADFRVRKLFLAGVVLALAVSAFAKMFEEPKSFSLKDTSQEQIERKVMPKFDAEPLLAEDRARGKDPQRPGPRRFAVAGDVAFSLTNSGTWQTLADGRLWRLRIQSPGAKSLNLGITRFDMSEGAKLWIYDPGHKHVEGPYTSHHRSRQGSLWTPVIEGEEMVVEVFVPSGVTQPVVEIGKVNQGYRSLVKTGEKSGIAGTEGACENDVVCPVGDPWRDPLNLHGGLGPIDAVGVYTINGTGVCTGTLLNNALVDFTPYVLSANHCGVNNANAATIVIYWHFEATVCGSHLDTDPNPLGQNQSGATFRASFAPSDFVLFELSDKPGDLQYNVFHAGWDRTGNIPAATVGIHQPEGDVKAISFSNTPPDTTAWGSSVHVAAGNHWYVLWNSGVTEPGSSGSCLFETTNQRCIGQLHGGPSACGGADLHDYYGRFFVSWTGGGTPNTRLSDWLDPTSTGILTLDGDPHITTANGIHYDFQGAGEFISLRDPDGLEIQTRQSPIATTFNPGPDAHDGLATCVSLNTAVAARVGKHRVTYEPNLSGVPDPSGLQLRVDGALTPLGPLDFGDGGRIATTSAPGGLEIDFPDASVLFVTPGWWASQSKWYLNVDLTRPSTRDGVSTGSFPMGGIAGPIKPGTWLPALPDGTPMGPMPGLLHQRYLDLYHKFADAWRVTDRTSLFDYAPGTSTSTFIMRDWPLENPPCVLPQTKPVEPTSQLAAQTACRIVTGDNARNNCVFDVRVTGNLGFAATYALTQRALAGSTRTTVGSNKNPTKFQEPVTFTATVAGTTVAAKGVPAGTVQFMLDGSKVGGPVRLNARGEAVWKTASLKPGRHKVSASFTPGAGSAFFASNSPDHIHAVGGPNE